MIAIFTALAPLFIITAMGYALASMKFGGPDMWQAIDHITFYLLFPALLAKTLMRADLGSVPAGDFLLVSLGSVTIMGAVLLAAYLVFEKPISGPAFTSVFQGAVRFQSTIAVAISAALFGESGLTFAALAVATLVPAVQLYTVAVLLIFGEGNGGVSAWPILRRVALNPFTLACLLGFILNRTGVPNFVYDTFSILGAASIGLTLLSVGAGLEVSSARAARHIVAASLAVRLVFMPLLVLGLSWLVGLNGLARTIAVIGDAELMAQIITFQSAGPAFTLPLFIYLSQNS